MTVSLPLGVREGTQLQQLGALVEFEKVQEFGAIAIHRTHVTPP